MPAEDDTSSVPVRQDRRPPDPVVRIFLSVWRWLDESPLRQIWPFVVGGLMAFGAVRLTGNVVWALGIVVVLYIVIYRVATRATAHEQSLRKTLD